MSPDQYNLLVNLVQAGLQKITDDATAALMTCRPQEEAEATEEKTQTQKKV